jgi:hypothetical protein
MKYNQQSLKDVVLLCLLIAQSTPRNNLKSLQCAKVKRSVLCFTSHRKQINHSITVSSLDETIKKTVGTAT